MKIIGYSISGFISITMFFFIIYIVSYFIKLKKTENMCNNDKITNKKKCKKVQNILINKKKARLFIIYLLIAILMNLIVLPVKSNIIQMGTILGGFALIIYSFINYWKSLGDITQIIILGISFATFIISSFRYKITFNKTN